MTLVRSARPALPALPESSFSHGQPRVIAFKHPGYSDYAKQNELLSLCATDSITGGIHYGTAWTACALVAGNAWNGYMTREREGARIILEDDELLTEESYYFHVPSTDAVEEQRAPYAIYPSFREWNFPHDDLPETWKRALRAQRQAVEERGEALSTPAASLWSAAVVNRDQRCIVTGQRDCCEAAHIVPRSEIDWFNRNRMSGYNLSMVSTGLFAVDDISNAISLRGDLHKSYDDKKFVIVPKEGRLLTHFLAPTTELGSLYHNTPANIQDTVSIASLLARFAWAIFPRVKLLEAGNRRLLRLQVVKDDQSTEIVQSLGYSEYKLRTEPRSRSSSPRKRAALSQRESEGDEEPNSGSHHKRPITAKWHDNLDAKVFETQIAMAKRRKVDNLRSLSSDPYPAWVSIANEKSTNSTSLSSPVASASREITPNTATTRPPLSSLTSQSFLEDEEGRIKLCYLEDLKRALLVAQRPTDPTLYCCDYGAAEADALAGIKGKDEFDGAYLCPECLGAEYRD